MARADAELLAARPLGTAGDRFVHAHLAGLRGRRGCRRRSWASRRARAAHGVGDARRGGTGGRDLVGLYFAGGAALRRAVEAGRSDVVDLARAEQAACAAEDFVDEVRALARAGRHGARGCRALLGVRARERAAMSRAPAIRARQA